MNQHSASKELDLAVSLLSIPQAAELSGEVAEAHKVANVPAVKQKIADLESRAAAGDLWDDPSKAAAVMEQLGSVKDDLATSEGLDAQLEDLQLALELLELEVSFGVIETG